MFNKLLEALPFFNLTSLHHSLRPKTINEYVGHTQYKDKAKLFDLILNAPLIPPLLLAGPPGIGKTSFARLIGKKEGYRYIEFNAIHKSFDTIRNNIFEAERFFREKKIRTFLFLDEIDHVDKENQKMFIPYMQKGASISLLAATAKNPRKILAPELFIRFAVIGMGKHNEKDLRQILERALHEETLGYGKRNIKMDADTKNYLCKVSEGNARAMLQILSQAVTFKMLMPKILRQTPSLHGGFVIDKSIIDAALANKKGKVSKKKIHAARLAALRKAKEALEQK